MGRTRVVNIRKETCDVYIGRAGYGKDGYFGNPFRLEATMAKGSTLGRYRKYFYHRLSTDKEFRKRIGNLQGKTLGCFCKPDPCHGDIIKEYLDWMAENANEAIVIGQIHWKGCVYPVREIDAGQHIHQGGLTAAVLPQQGEDLTTVQGQIDAIVGDDAAETFGDVSQLNGANSFQGCHPFVVNWGAAAPVRFPDNI